MLVTAMLAEPGTADGAILRLFPNTRVAYVIAHFAVYGCFAAWVERHGDEA